MQSVPYWWSGPIGGLGNRLIAIAAVKACIDKQVICFPWLNDPSCPGEYEDILDPLPNLMVRKGPSSDAVPLHTQIWEPLNIYSYLNEVFDLKLSQSDFCKRLVFELRHLPFKLELTEQARQWRNGKGDVPMLGVHIRRTDRAAQHRNEFREFVLRKQGLSGELPLYLSALYGVFPSAFMQFYEDAVLCKSIGSFKKLYSNFNYSIFSDDHQQVLGLEKTAAFFGITRQKHLTRTYFTDSTKGLNGKDLRQTDIKGALVDLLCLSQCDAILQNNRASTFSLVASIIGATPIVTAKTHYPFWLAIEEATSLSPSHPDLSFCNL